MSNEGDWKVAADLEVDSTIPLDTIIAAVKGQGSKSSKDAGPQQYKRAGKKPAKKSGPQQYKKGR